MAVWLLWTTVLAVMLRPWLRLPLLPWKGKERNAVIRELKPASYILLVGVFGWGWTCFFATILFDYLSRRYFGERALASSPSEALGRLLIYSLVGIWFGWTMKNSSQGLARYKNPIPSSTKCKKEAALRRLPIILRQNL
jgi:hypothetical protein